jgi:hypothetical protein
MARFIYKAQCESCLKSVNLIQEKRIRKLKKIYCPRCSGLIEINPNAPFQTEGNDENHPKDLPNFWTAGLLSGSLALIFLFIFAFIYFLMVKKIVTPQFDYNPSVALGLEFLVLGALIVELTWHHIKDMVKMFVRIINHKNDEVDVESSESEKKHDFTAEFREKAKILMTVLLVSVCMVVVYHKVFGPVSYTHLTLPTKA